MTVLFADVMGSMDMAEQADPEEWRQIMQRFFSILSDGVRRFEGTVDKFTGDGIMAVFGAPIAHEDHAAARLLRGAADARRRLRVRGRAAPRQGLNFSVRIGINSGEVVAGAIGEDGEREYTAVGHTVGLAQRMEALAEPGKAYLTEHAAELAQGYLELEDLGEFEIKGASRPIRVFELVGVGLGALAARPLARARLLPLRRPRRGDGGCSRRRSSGPRTGEGARGRRRRRARASARAASATSSPSAAGRAGSRSTRRRRRRTGRRSRFMPVLQMLRGYFGIEDRDSERVAREKIAGRLLLLDPDFADDLPLLFDFLGVPDPERPAPQLSAEARQRLLRGVVRRLYRAPGARTWSSA